MEVDEVTAIYPRNTQDISFALYNARQVDQTIPYYVLSEKEISIEVLYQSGEPNVCTL